MSSKSGTSRRTVVKGILLSFVTLLFPLAAQAAGPTLKATRVGQKIVWRGYVYTVVLSKGKLVWKQGAKVATASASASAKPTVASAPSESATATPPPSVSSGPVITSDGALVGFSSEIKEGQTKILEVNTAKNQYPEFAFTRSQGKLYAVSTICTHAACKVAIEKNEIVCNCHMSYFDRINGKALAGPAKDPLTQYEVTERDGKIYIKP